MKKVSKMTPEEHKRALERDRLRRASKKNGTALLNKSSSKSHKIIGTDKIPIPKPKEVEPILIHIVKPDDVVKFIGWSKDKITQFAVEIIRNTNQ